MKTSITCLLLACLLSLSAAHNLHWQLIDLIASKPIKEQFKLWHYYFQKAYDINSSEGHTRFANFQKNVKKISEFNQLKSTYTLGLSELSDEDFDEDNFPKADTHQVADTKLEEDYFDRLADQEDIIDQGDSEDSKDWSYLYETNYPKIDGTGIGKLCYFLWSQPITIAYTINGHLWINNEKEEPVSAQFLRNCSREGVEQCLYLSPLINYVKLINKHGIPREKDLPWVEKKDKECKFPPNAEKLNVYFTYCYPYLKVQDCNNAVLDSYLAIGPYASQLEKNFDVFHYREGIYKAENCIGSTLAVIVVQKTKEYVKAVHPLGKKSGENGFIRVENENGPPHPEKSCGLKTFAILPEISTS